MLLKVFNPSSSLWEGGGDGKYAPSLNFKYNPFFILRNRPLSLKVFNPSSSLCHLSLFHPVLCHCFKVKD